MVLALSASAADWPQFRGPNRDDVSKETGLLKEWPKDGPKLDWKGTGVGGGYSSLAVAGDNVYTLGNQRDKTRLYVLNRKTGKVLWSVEVGSAGGNLGCTPTADGSLVYTITQAGDLACVDTKEKKVIWSKNFGKDFDGKSGGWRYCESPLIDGDKLICTPGGKNAIMAAFNKKTGKLIWKSPSPFSDPTAGYSSPVISMACGVRQYVQLAAGGTLGVSAKDGKVLWTYPKFGGNTANIPTPIILGDKVLTITGYGRGGALLELSSDGKGGVKAKPVYYKSELTNKHGGVVVVGDYMYADSDDSGRPFCAEVKTGKVVWKQKRDGGGSAAVTYADGHLYFLHQNGNLALVKATPDEYQEVSRFKVPGIGDPAWAHPVVAGGKLYLRGNNGTVFCYDVKAK
jgi:outer membrane protein assembly factor BamB